MDEQSELYGRANRSCQDSFKHSFDKSPKGITTQPSENTAAFLRNLNDTGREILPKPTIIPSQLTIGSSEQSRPSYTSAFQARKSLVASVPSRERTR